MWSEETQSCTYLYARASLKYTALLKSHAMWVVCVALEHDSPCGGAKKRCALENKKNTKRIVNMNTVVYE